MIFECVADVVRTIEDTVRIAVEADNQDDALDLAYEIASSYPNSDINAERYLTIARFWHEPDAVNVKLLVPEIGENDLD